MAGVVYMQNIYIFFCHKKNVNNTSAIKYLNDTESQKIFNNCFLSYDP